MVFLTMPCDLTPASVKISTEAATSAPASPGVSRGGSAPALPPASNSRRCSTHTSPLDSRAKSRAARTARSETGDWSTATRIFSYMTLIPFLYRRVGDPPAFPFPFLLLYRRNEIRRSGIGPDLRPFAPPVSVFRTAAHGPLDEDLRTGIDGADYKWRSRSKPRSARPMAAFVAAAGGEQEDRAEAGHATEAEGGQGDDVGDLGDLPPAVGVQQHAAQRLALEDCADQAGELGVVRLGQGLSRQLGVGLAAGHVGDVDGDEVVGVGLGLLAGEQLLPGVLADRRDHAGRDLGPGLGVGERGGRGEGDLLGGEVAR